MSQEPQRNRLPFEPKRKKPAKNNSTSKASETPESGKPKDTARRPISKEDRAIPEVVSQRMVSRMAILCGVPTALGMFTFIASYFVISGDLFPLPNFAVVLVSMGCFGLGVIGLTYGVLSASWDEEIPGSLLGWQEFTTNFGRMNAARREAKQKSQ
ncbi:PAM68 family protein [Laspinema olomoucense]|uniref:PAM68 family protein n=1 Tax=Laspinema olomoucense D3b TaxID=2953688 RepID=A0ABT2N966_9CYAN|nr:MULTISPECIES: PAM68 family protein [unclassified Laspinema]MCT7975160.1 PAM68 family protein [Laspinema sp. D3d]MCT7979234.1 PAM68 family protein [Laspinema sp. D3b]MCT7990674.1 PAM68 family protein [Laspinema sp. D3a]MCT7996707.1 PAM68 family protein [Laspinema sp. D3c]